MSAAIAPARTFSLVGGREFGLAIEIFLAVETVQELRQKRLFLTLAFCCTVPPHRAAICRAGIHRNQGGTWFHQPFQMRFDLSRKMFNITNTQSKSEIEPSAG